MIRRRSGVTRRWAIIATGLVALSLTGLALASAANLNVTNGGVAVASESRCTDGPVPATGGASHAGPNYYSMEITSLAAGCEGMPIQVVAYGSGGTELWAASLASAPAAPFDLTTASSVTYVDTDVVGVALLVGTWGVPATWTTPPPTACTTTSIALAPANPVGGSGKYRDVSFSSVDAACVGGALVVTLYDSSGGVVATASGTVPSGASFALSTGGQYRPVQVVPTTISLTIDGFTIPYTWTP